MLYASDIDNDILHRVDLVKGMGTVIGILPGNISRLAYDPNRDILYGVIRGTTPLYS